MALARLYMKLWVAPCASIAAATTAQLRISVVMLNQQESQLKFFPKLYQQLVQFFCLLPIHASCRFIKQQ